MNTRYGGPKFSRRNFIKAGAVAGVGLAASQTLLACTPTPNTAAPGGGELIAAQGSGPAHLNPIGAGLGGVTYAYFYTIFDGLVRRNIKREIEPGLAASWRNPDPNTWEFKLRQGVKFHNGEPFDATAVKFTMDRILDPSLNSVQRGRFSEVDGVEIVDPMTVRIHTKSPFPVLLFGLWQAFMQPPKYVGENPAKALAQPIGTGPFKFVDYTLGDRMHLVANDDYWGGRPSLDKITYRIIPDETTRLAALKAFDIHINRDIALDNVDSVANDPNLKITSAFLDSGLVLEFNTKVGGPLADPVVRTALNHAVDKDTINRELLRGKMRPLQGQVMTEGGLGFNANLKAFAYDPAKAKQLLAQAGYANGFDIEIATPVGRYPADKDMCVAIASQLANVGVRAQVTVVEAGQYLTRLAANGYRGMFLIRWDNSGDAAFSTPWFTQKSTLGQYYVEPTYDDLVQKATTTLDTKQRQSLYEQASQYMYDKAMALFLFQPGAYDGVNKKVDGYEGTRPDTQTFFNTVRLNK